jgi:hypothetical protein
MFYTGIGKDVSKAKKIENLSGRDEVCSRDMMFISSKVYKLCCECKSHGVKLHSKDVSSLPTEKHTFYFIGCEDADNADCSFGSCCIDKNKCPLQRRCKGCIKNNKE